MMSPENSEFWTAYSAIVSTIACIGSTIAVVWHLAKDFRHRRRLAFSIVSGKRTSITPDAEGYHTQYYITVLICNNGGTEEVVRSWGVSGVSKNEGPTLIDLGGILTREDGTQEGFSFPVRLAPGELIEIDLTDWSILRKDFKHLYLIDGRGKRWYLPSKARKAALKHVEYVDRSNANRKADDAPQWGRQGH